MPSSHGRIDDPTTELRSRPGAILGLLLLAPLLAGAYVGPVDGVRAIARVRVTLDGGRFLPTPDGLALQRTLWDCGPTALHNLLRALGRPSPGPAELARRSGTGVGGTILAGLVRTARSEGVSLRAVRASPEDLLTIPTPYLAWLGEGHFVTVVTADAAGRLTVHDPGVGLYRIHNRAFRRRWGGVVAHPTAATASRAAPGPSVLPEPPERFGIHLPSDRRRP